MSALDELRMHPVPRPDELCVRHALHVMPTSARIVPGIVYGATVALLATVVTLGVAVGVLRLAGTHAGDVVESAVILPLLVLVQIPIWIGFVRLTRRRREAVALIVREGNLVDGVVISSRTMRRNNLHRIGLDGGRRFLISPLRPADMEIKRIPVLVRDGSRKAICYGAGDHTYLRTIHLQRGISAP